MRKKGHIVFDLKGRKLKGRWHLVKTRSLPGEKSQWLLFKSAKDEYAQGDYDVVTERPESVVSGKRVTRGPERRGRPAPLPKKPSKKLRPKRGAHTRSA